MKGRELDVIVAGDLFVDLILSGFPDWPAPGSEAFASDLRKDVGGGAAISACGLARLGSRTAILSVAGRDAGVWVAERLSSFGVDTSELRVEEQDSTALSVAISTPEDRTFLTYPGANRKFPAVLIAAAQSAGLARARHVHLGWAPDLNEAADLLQAISGNGCSLSVDTGWHEAWLADSRTRALLPGIDIFFPNEMEARRMSGQDTPEDCLRWFEAAGAKLVALKLGSRGAALLCAGEILRVPPVHVECVDTIGAGDSFDAGFLHYWLRGAEPLLCLQAANFCGAASTEGFGGLEAFPAPERVERAIRQFLCEK